jgi:hypothetical protein
MRRTIILIILLFICLTPTTAIPEEVEKSPRYAPATEELTEEALSYSELTHEALLNWEVVDFKKLTSEMLLDIGFLGDISEGDVEPLTYGEEVKYSKEGKGLYVVVLEFKDEVSAMEVFSKAKKWASDRGAVPSSEFGDEGYATGERSPLPYINSYRLGRFIVYVQEEEANFYDVKMMARKIMTDIIPYHKEEVLKIGPIKISAHQFYPYVVADSRGLYLVGLKLYLTKKMIIGIIFAALFSGFLFVIGVVLLFLWWRGVDVIEKIEEMPTQLKVFFRRKRS